MPKSLYTSRHQVFEKVNTGGKKLDAFELLTAIYASDDFNLRDDWLGNAPEGIEGRATRLARFDVLKPLQSTDIHHIFPRAWCQKQGDLKPDDFDSIINKTPLSARTNRIICAKAPSQYLPALEAEAGISPQRMDEFLGSHAIDPTQLRTDNFASFFAARTEALLKVIENAMGKSIPRDQISEGEDPCEEIGDALDSVESEVPA